MPKARGRWSWVYFITLWGKDLLWDKAESVSGPFLPSGSKGVGEASHLLPLQWLSFFSLPLGGPVGWYWEEAVPGLQVLGEPTDTFRQRPESSLPAAMPFCIPGLLLQPSQPER